MLLLVPGTVGARTLNLAAQHGTRYPQLLETSCCHRVLAF